MTYVKRGPFVNASPTGPYVDATFFNNVETALAAVSETMVNRISVVSGATFTIAMPGLSGGLLTIHGTAGGAWSSIWHGIWASDGARIDLTQLGTDFTTPGQLIVSVVGSTTDTTVTVTSAASGSTALFDYLIKPITG